MSKVTKAQFRAKSIKNIASSEEALKEKGLEMRIFPCDCDYELCEGWRLEIHPRHKETQFLSGKL